MRHQTLMKQVLLRLVALWAAGLGLGWEFSAAGAEARQARAEYRNVTSQNATQQQQNPGVAFFGGYIRLNGDGQTGNSYVLQQCAFGQPFSQWFPSETFSRDSLGNVGKGGILGDLYASGENTSFNEVAKSDKPFRYLLLMYNRQGTDVTSFDPTKIEGWFTDKDRATISSKIAELKLAVAVSPLDMDLRGALLDVVHDLAVAELQAVKPKLAELAKIHLGLDALRPGEFIIDREIATYTNILAGIQKAIDQYASLLTEPFPNIDPSSVDQRIEPGSMTMGEYIFRMEQPRRNTAASQFVGATAAQPVPRMVDGKLDTGPMLFKGYKDLNALLQILAQRQQHLASLARLLGTRQAEGDLATARQRLEEATVGDDESVARLKRWFPELFIADWTALSPAQVAAVKNALEQSGVFGAITAIEAGRMEMMAVLPFLNGSANLLGYDPNFLLVVQDNSGHNPPLDSFDTLRNLLLGDNRPLTVALNALRSTPGVNPPDGAQWLYENFVEKVEKVTEDIDAATDAYASRYEEITGYRPDDVPGFDLSTTPLKPKPGSELHGVLQTIANLEIRQATNKILTSNIEELLRHSGTNIGDAYLALSNAEEKLNGLLSAQQKYKNATKPYYEDIIEASVNSAALQATFDAANAVGSLVTAAASSTDLAGKIVGGVSAGVVGALGVGNIAVQTVSARTIASRERDIDYAGMDFTVDTQLPDATLAVNQAKQQLQALKREQVSQQLSVLADQGALDQANNQKQALVKELTRIKKQSEGAVAAIRKKSYASPLSYYRSESALIRADETFRTAQRWMFYALQALNYKWSGRFSIVDNGRTYDSSTLFKCRNAAELKDLLKQMENWDAYRSSQTQLSGLLVSRISLRDHILARNPNRFSVDKADPGVRCDDTISTRPMVLPMVSPVTYFQNLLASRYLDADGKLDLKFSTALANEDALLVDANFFRGASYNSDGSLNDAGFWIEKIEYVKVNLVSDDAPEFPTSLSGGLAYGGMVYFHTRVPPTVDRVVVRQTVDDAPGELLMERFRYWVSPNFDENFFPLDFHKVSIPIAFNRKSTIDPAVLNSLGTSFQVNDFAGRSIAATEWHLTILTKRAGATILNVRKLRDIEIIIAYRHAGRLNISQ